MTPGCFCLPAGGSCGAAKRRSRRFGAGWDVFEGLVAAGKDMGHMREGRDLKTLDKISELEALLEGLNRIVGGYCPRFAGLVDAGLVEIRSVLTAALPESEIRVHEEVCNVCDTFPVDLSSDALGPPAGGSFHQAFVFSVV